MEYNYAKEKKIPILAFIYDNLESLKVSEREQKIGICFGILEIEF